MKFKINKYRHLAIKYLLPAAVIILMEISLILLAKIDIHGIPLNTLVVSPAPVIANSELIIEGIDEFSGVSLNKSRFMALELLVAFSFIFNYLIVPGVLLN